MVTDEAEDMEDKTKLSINLNKFENNILTNEWKIKQKSLKQTKKASSTTKITRTNG